MAAQLAAASSCERPQSLAWEPSLGWLLDWQWGRGVLFLCRPAGTDARDVFRARVRVTAEGAALGVAALGRITETPLGDERELSYDGRFAAFQTYVADEPQGATLIKPGVDAAFFPGPTDLGWLWDWLRVPTLEQVGRVHFRAQKGHRTELRVESGGVGLADEGGVKSSVSFAALQEGGVAAGVEYSPQSLRSSSALQAAVELLRAFVGPGAVTWLERRVFGMAEAVREQTTRSAQPATPTPGEVSDARSSERLSWPPPRVTPLVSPALKGEGEWRTPSVGWDGFPRERFRQTSLRVDPKRPYAALDLIAMDMRFLTLGMEGGASEPRPKTGPPGSGALPRDPAVQRRVVATFNGGFKSLHGDYGMMVNGRLLVPAVAGAATVLTLRDGRVGFGTWPQSLPVVPPEVASFRQNLEPLIAGGTANPTERKAWGEHLVGSTMATLRSALCRTVEGQILYGIGRHLTGADLARGMRRAGCDYAIHLDMNPGHAGFFFHRVVPEMHEETRSLPAVAGLTMPPERHLYWSEKDFFYVATAGAPDGQEGALSWRASPGQQPEPEEPAAIRFREKRHGELKVSLLRLAPGRLRAALVAGLDEPLIAGRAAPIRDLPAGARPLLSAGLGTTTYKQRLGLAFAEDASLPLRSDTPSLVIEDGQVSFAPAGQLPPLAEAVTVVQLPALVEQGSIAARAHETGARRLRGAICVGPDGSVFVATAIHDSSDVLALTLLDEQCADVLELDRGAKHPAAVWRAGASGEFAAHVPTATRLVFMASSLRPRTFAWAPSSDRAQ